MPNKKVKSTKAKAKTQRKDIADEEDVIVSGSEDAVLTMKKSVPDKNVSSSDKPLLASALKSLHPIETPNPAKATGRS